GNGPASGGDLPSRDRAGPPGRAAGPGSPRRDRRGTGCAAGRGGPARSRPGHRPPGTRLSARPTKGKRSMTVIVCAATECIHNDGGICCNDEVTFTFVGGSHVEMTCESFEPRGPGDPKVWRGDTYAYDNRVEERSES